MLVSPTLQEPWRWRAHGLNIVDVFLASEVVHERFDLRVGDDAHDRSELEPRVDVHLPWCFRVRGCVLRASGITAPFLLRVWGVLSLRNGDIIRPAVLITRRPRGEDILH